MRMSAILAMWPEQLVSILANWSQVVFLWNLSSIGLMVSVKTMLQYIVGTPIWATLAERSKVNLDLWNLCVVIISSEHI